MSKNEMVYQDLRKKILSGYYAPFSALDNEAVLCKRYGVSRPTLQKAIARLKQDGFVHSQQGSGVYVNSPEFFKQTNLLTLSERYRNSSSKITSEVLCLERVAMGEYADTFHLPSDETLIHYQRVRYVDGKPHSYEDTHMPAYLFKDFNEKALQGSMISYIEDACGYQVSHDMKRVSAVHPSREVADCLGVSTRTPLLKIDHFVYLVRSVVVQYTEEITLDEHLLISENR
ncbi:GntR family transcriptional regulator [Thermophilibacter sp.]